MKKDDRNLSTSDTSFHQWPRVYIIFYLLHMDLCALCYSINRTKVTGFIFHPSSRQYCRPFIIALLKGNFSFTAREKADNDDVYIKNYTRYNCISPPYTIKIVCVCILWNVFLTAISCFHNSIFCLPFPHSFIFIQHCHHRETMLTIFFNHGKFPSIFHLENSLLLF